MSDLKRTALIQLLTNWLSFVVLIGVLHLSAEELAAAGIVINSSVGTVFLFWKQGQSAPPVTGTPKP